MFFESIQIFARLADEEDSFILATGWRGLTNGKAPDREIPGLPQSLQTRPPCRLSDLFAALVRQEGVPRPMHAFSLP